MINDYRLNVELTTTDLQDIEIALDTLESKLDFLRSIPEEERAHKIRLGTNNLAFVQMAKEAYDERPYFLPRIHDNVTYENDYHLLFDLRPLQSRMEGLAQALGDTSILVGNDVYKDSLSIFHSAREGMRRGIDGSRHWARKLAIRFENNGPGNGLEVDDEVPMDGQPDNVPDPDPDTGDNN